MFRAHGGTVIAGKVVYAATCLVAAVVMVVGGYAHYFYGQVSGVASSDILPPGPQTGEMNILLMGLESRTDYQGNILSPGLLAAMHAGSVQGVENGVGGQDTNTLILIHVFAGGQKAVGVSIPRDDWVTYPHTYDGQSQGKIDQAYGDAWSQSLSQTYGSKISKDQRYFLANEAGQKAAIDTVQKVTGQHIDHFAEVNLAGFYTLAQVLGPVEVCVKSWNGGQNLHDANSGFNQKHAGYLKLWAPQALAFVRERDNLPQGDIDRTYRQQAVIDFVIWKLEHEGVLTDLGQLTSLVDVAKKYVITDSGWDIPLFAGEMHALTGKNMSFHTAPTITTDGHIGTQIVNLVDIPTIQRDVKEWFTAPPTSSGGGGGGGGGKTVAKPKHTAAPIPAPSTVTVDVYNSSGAPLLATHVSQALVALGYKAGTNANTSAQSQPAESVTQVFYGAGAAANAAKIARYFGSTAATSTSLPAGQVKIVLGTTVTAVPPALLSSGAASSGAASSGATATTPGASATSPSSKPSTDTGPVLTVGANARYGIPCVY